MAQVPGGPNTRPGGPRNFDPSQFQKMLEDRLKERLGVSEEEWAAVAPRLEKVLAAQMSMRGAGMGMLFGGGPGGPGGGFGGDAANLTPIARAARDLQAAIDANAGPDELTAKMAAYRDAQEKARQDLADARKSLKELLTHKQEAELLMFGILD